MDKQMEKMFAQDLGISVDSIRNASWRELDKLSKRNKERPFRPKNMFVIGGNIHLAQNHTMGMTRINFNDFCREVIYQIRCLTKTKKRT